MQVVHFYRMLEFYLKLVSIVFALVSIIIFSSYALIIKKFNSSINTETSNSQVQPARKRSERKLILTSCLVSATCLICYLPYVVVVWISILWVFRFQVCVCLATLLNPLVYFFSSCPVYHILRGGQVHCKIQKRLTAQKKKSIIKGEVEMSHIGSDHLQSPHKGI